MFRACPEPVLNIVEGINSALWASPNTLCSHRDFVENFLEKKPPIWYNRYLTNKPKA
jgi:hypothetical protein